MRTVNGNILAEKSSETEEMANGLIINAEQSSRRKIVSGKIVVPAGDLMEGQIIMFPLYAADPVNIRGEEYWIINYMDIKVVVE